MSVVQFWRERLAAKCPLYSTWLPRSDYKVHQERMDSWPHSVCRDVLYRDYVIWHNEVFISPYRAVPYFKGKLPEAVDSLTFFSAMAPYLYIAGKDVQVRNYLVPCIHEHEGRKVVGKKWRYFVRLCEWETHVAAFELLSGVSIAGNVRFFEAEKAKRMAQEVSAFRVKIVETTKPATGG